MIFSLAHPYGTPTILSSYSGFTNTDAGSPNGGKDILSFESSLTLRRVFRRRNMFGHGRDEWLALPTSLGGDIRNGRIPQQRWSSTNDQLGVASITANRFRTWSVSPTRRKITLLNTQHPGTLGFVAINNADSAWTTSFTTSLPDGSYCDVISGQSVSGSCTGLSFVDLSIFKRPYTDNIGCQIFRFGWNFQCHCSFSECYCHTRWIEGARIREWNCDSQFCRDSDNHLRRGEQSETDFGQIDVMNVTIQNIFLVGSIPQLGNWNPSSAVRHVLCNALCQ